MELKNKVAIVTGASSGIGKAVAQNLSEAGCKVLVTGRRAERLNDLTQDCVGSVALAGDIADPETPDLLFQAAEEKLGPVDIVFNNAGIIEVGPIDKIDIDRVCQMVRINVEAAFRLIYTSVKYFKKRGSGHLVNTSSILGTKTRPTAGAYAGTKYAIEAVSESLRMELAGTDIQVSCVEPGLVYTELHDSWEKHPTEMFGIEHPLTPEDIARMVRFILEQPSHVRIPRLLVLPGEHEI
ncbi:MAG: SDR family oxidoreductase [Candidatus Omnitrophica bacterium]|nr:SDR family oxidoreductase [Candidatus Omnitrophota bacterium]MCA9428459.1 SDR family oxidoreductase [Candidatus Omnitrophota bacterium]MCA9432120.1 SDR family oxidoreductase [Candidatus Omnitrophota bacterium]MCB9766877.1 SDR family oxidoreductase [Candidatus Omnitrophota bacterium]MCB9782667.1 SDR family oxidoreductase [Candidatus Omnitrophota bacterium]